MLGWDVGYVWPLIEGIHPSVADNSWRAPMGNLYEARTAAEPEPPPYRPEPPRRAPCRRPEVTRRQRPVRWPHQTASLFACLSCVLGVSNISRFSTLVHIYKGSFVVQFLILSFLIGIPLFYLLMVLGQYIGAGMLDMWHISPAFKGLGFAMLYIYVILGIYNAIPLSWLFVYFKDSFITLKDSYKWGKCQMNFARTECLRALNTSSADFYGWSVPSYFHGRLLGRKPEELHVGELKFEIAFNLCLVWLIIFVCLSRGQKTFSKVVYVFGMLPIVLLLVVTMRMSQQWSHGIVEMVTAPWNPAITDPSVWFLAIREVFITWGLLGVVALHICSHNKSSTSITRNLIAIVVTAFSVFIMTAILIACIDQLFRTKNLSYTLSSYEEEYSVRVLRTGTSRQENVSVISLILGEGIFSSPRPHQSGYQVLRLVTEAFPASLAVEGVRNISSFWSICFYAAMIMFGLGQQVVLWFCVIESVKAINYKVFKAWHTTLTFLTCNVAFLLGLPITSNIGIYIVYYLDFCFSSLWWIVLMYFTLIFAILFIRGHPFGTDNLVNLVSRDIQRRKKLKPFFTFLWNAYLPLTLLIMVIVFLKSSSVDPSSLMGRLLENYDYWHHWAKSLVICIQMFPLVLVFTVCAYQAILVFIAKTDLPFTERLKLLCRPTVALPGLSSRQSSLSSQEQGSSNDGFVDDPPPKYTPPPSYSTATSRMLAKKMSTYTLDLDDSINEQPQVR